MQQKNCIVGQALARLVGNEQKPVPTIAALHRVRRVAPDLQVRRRRAVLARIAFVTRSNASLSTDTGGQAAFTGQGGPLLQDLSSIPVTAVKPMGTFRANYLTLPNTLHAGVFVSQSSILLWPACPRTNPYA